MDEESRPVRLDVRHNCDREGFRFSLVYDGVESDGFHRFRLLQADDEVMSLLWPVDDSDEVWTELGERWVDNWQYHTSD